MKKAKFIGSLLLRGVSKDKWECPICREKEEPECRFNLSLKKRGSIQRCRFCGEKLELNYDDKNGKQ